MSVTMPKSLPMSKLSLSVRSWNVGLSATRKSRYVSAALHVVKVPVEGETPNIVGVACPEDIPELHGPLECLMRARCVHEQGKRYGVAAPVLHPWPQVLNAQPFVQLVFIGAHRSEEHTSELQSHHDLVCRLLLE